MRTTEAARYARWSVTVAVMLTLVVAGVYIRRVWEAQQAQNTAPPPVPAAVQQQSAEFTFSTVHGNRTQFIVHASHATEFKEGGRTLLEDVGITTFGGDGRRSDQLHTRACEYFAASGIITCPEEVMMDLQSGGPESPGAAKIAQQGDSPASSAHVVHVMTSHLTFNRQTGVASSEQPVEFRFAEGEGHAVGLTYDSQRGELRLLHEVELVFRSGPATPVDSLAGNAITISSGELLYRRDERSIHLSGSARLSQGRQELRAGQMTLDLDEQMRAQRLVARDSPILHDPSDTSDVTLSADELAAPLSSMGRVEQVIATGHVALSSIGSGGRDQLTAAASVLDLVPESQQPRHFTANGAVVVRSVLSDGSTRNLESSQLDLDFVSSENDSRIERARATAATVEWEDAGQDASHQKPDHMRLAGRTLDGSFGESGELRELRGDGGVEVQRHMAGGPPMTSTSRDLVARIAPDGLWSTVDQSGDVRLKNASGDAKGERAHFDRAGDTVTLTGSVILTDASSQTRAQSATFHQTANELRAEGKVATTDLSSAASPSDGTSGGAADEPAHVLSDRMVADTAAGHAVYSGKARMWQGDSVIQADTIDLDRAKRTLVATGKVNAVFPQARQSQNPPPATSGKVAKPAGPDLWRAEAGRMTYIDDEQRAKLEMGAHARSSEGSMVADSMDLFFVTQPGPAGSPPAGGKTAAKASGLTGLGSGFASQQLQRAQGVGNVHVESAGRIGTGEQATYGAAEGKFILFGGRPILTDQFGNSIAGRQLTFLFSDDRIVVDSEEGSRTLTLHRVEK